VLGEVGAAGVRLHQRQQPGVERGGHAVGERAVSRAALQRRGDGLELGLAVQVLHLAGLVAHWIAGWRVPVWLLT